MKTWMFILVALLCVVPVLAEDNYKPYLHEASVPGHPDVQLYGEYATYLYAGAATYNYPVAVPDGVHGLQPSVKLLYNSQAFTQPSVVGAGWQVNQDMIYRDVNGSVSNTSDDAFFLVLDGNRYELVYQDGSYHTKVEYYYKIQNYSNHWTVTKKDGTIYSFGLTSSARIGDDQWFLEQVQDTYGNKLYYEYLANPFAEDENALYLDRIVYNSDRLRVIDFSYEDETRPDLKTTYADGFRKTSARRLQDISILVGGSLVKRHHFSYVALGSALTTISNITLYGEDNQSSLYTISFSYYDTVTGYTKSADYKPPVLFSDDAHTDYGVRLIDLNHDGFMDLIQKKPGTSQAWINGREGNWTETNAWALPVDIVNSNGIDEGVRFVDVNKDGLVDVIKAKDGAAFATYLNNGSGWQEDTSWDAPAAFVSSAGVDQGLRFADVNADGYPDLIKARAGARAIYMNNRNGWTASSWNFPLDIVDTSGNDKGVRLVDINHDGLVDIMQGKDTVKVSYINNGSGFVSDDDWAPPVAFTTTSKPDNGVRFADVNGDSFVDLLEDFYNGTSEKGAWLNTGHGWTSSSGFEAPEAFTKNGHNIGRRLADVNGDGLADIIVSHEESSQQYAWLKNSTTPFILASVVNAYGGKTNISYTVSTAYNSTKNNSSQLGFAIFVVGNISTDNNLSEDFAIQGMTGYSYAGGRYDYKHDEFRGFAQVTETFEDKIVDHYFYQDDPRKGIEYQTAIKDEQGVVVRKQRQAYNYTIDRNIYNLSILYKTTFLYDGAVEPVVTNTSYFYNRFGNYEYIVNQGNVAIQGDERYYNYSYALNTHDWVVDKVARMTVYDEAGRKVQETKYYYDRLGLTGIGSAGSLTKVIQWNNYGKDIFTLYAYDTHGNVVSQSDAYGQMTKYVYDDLHTHLTQVINPKGQIARYAYDLGTGQLLWQEVSGVRTTYLYDVFGRKEKEIRPYDTVDLPTKAYTYDFDGVAPETVKITQKTTANKTSDITYYYDGFGNLIQLQVAAGQRNIVTSFLYDSQGRVLSAQQPFFAASEGLVALGDTGFTNYSYDALSRTVMVENPDSSAKVINFSGLTVTSVDENGHVHEYDLDAYDRIVAVREYNDNDVGINETYTTTYAYDGNDNLMRVIDAQGNVFSFLYDSLGRKIFMDDPDLGSWSYEYDQDGRLIAQTDARGYTVTLTYDELGRVVRKSSADQNISFQYDDQYDGVVSKVSVGEVNFSFVYDDRFRVVEEEQEYGTFNFSQEFMYDSADRLVSLQGPSKIDFLFNQQGLIKEITGFVNSTGFEAFGGLANKTYANGLTTTYAYDNSNRLQTISVPGVQDSSYAYDAVGNIVSINDTIMEKLSVMSYDALDRLRTVDIGDDHYAYSFNPIGNLMKLTKNGETKKYVYDGTQVHAPSRIIESASGVDMYSPHEVDTGSKTRLFEFWLIGDDDHANVSLGFGDGNLLRNESLNVSGVVWGLVSHNYAAGGDYEAVLNVSSNGLTDSENVGMKFGTRARSLQRFYSNVSNHYFELIIDNDVSEPVHNVGWNCTDGLSSLYLANLSGDSSLMDFFVQNYSLPGEKQVTCTATSDDGNESASTTFTIKGLAIEEYDVLIENVSSRILSFDVVNHFMPIEANISFDTGEAASWQEANISTDEKVMVFAAVNYSHDGENTFSINVTNDNYRVDLEDAFIEGYANIVDYMRASKGLSQVFAFQIRNDWRSGQVYWNSSELNLSNNVSVGANESIFVFVEKNFDQGTYRPLVSARTDTHVDKVQDYFMIKPLEIASLQTLSEGASAVAEMLVRNNEGTNQSFDWTYNTGVEEVGAGEINLATADIFLFIESQYPVAGVYKTSARVNSTDYADTARGVIVSE